MLAGLPTISLSLLAIPDGKEWAAKKARVLSIAGGRFDGGAADSVIEADVAGFRKLLADWPTQIVMAGAELNDALPFPGSSLDAIAAWAPNHPVVDAYRAFKAMPYDAPSQALAAVLYAVSPEDNYFELSEPGTISVRRQRPDTIHALTRRQASLLDRQARSEGACSGDLREDGQSQPPPPPGAQAAARSGAAASAAAGRGGVDAAGARRVAAA